MSQWRTHRPEGIRMRLPTRIERSRLGRWLPMEEKGSAVQRAVSGEGTGVIVTVWYGDPSGDCGGWSCTQVM
eukprot:1866969-Pleurochrysis_carterae.AAC.2